MSGKTEREVWSGGVLELSGRDAGAFAQAQLMNDVRVLADAQWQWTGWLNPKGRVIALGALLRLAEDRYWLALPDYPAERLVEELRRYVFRSKLTLAPRVDLHAGGLWLAPDALGRPARHDRFHFDGALATLDLGGERPRSLLLGPEANLAADVCAASTWAAWALEDLAHGLPRLPEAAVASHTPQMLGLERLNAYSVKKGCYPGQEIVARTHFLGQAKRGLRRLRGPASAGDALRQGDRLVGEVLCSAGETDRQEALAVLPLDLGAAPVCTPSNESLTMVEFAYGLAR